MKKNYLILAISFSIFMSGCGNHASIAQLKPTHAPISTDIKYELVGDADASAKKCFFFGIGNIFADSYSATLPVYDDIGTSSRVYLKSTAGIAAYEALASIPDADALFAPRFNEKREYFWPVFFCDSIEIHAKAIRYYQPGKLDVKEELVESIPEPKSIDPTSNIGEIQIDKKSEL